jgi:hypothetical protein
MANGWTEERRRRQAAIIHTWNPSGQSTGPRTADGKARSSLNAVKHGGRARNMRRTLDSFKKTLRLQQELLVTYTE